MNVLLNSCRYFLFSNRQSLLQTHWITHNSFVRPLFYFFRYWPRSGGFGWLALPVASTAFVDIFSKYHHLSTFWNRQLPIRTQIYYTSDKDVEEDYELQVCGTLSRRCTFGFGFFQLLALQFLLCLTTRVQPCCIFSTPRRDKR